MKQLKIDDDLVLRMVAREIRDNPTPEFYKMVFTDEKSERKVNLANQKTLLGTFIFLYKEEMDPERYSQARRDLEALNEE